MNDGPVLCGDRPLKSDAKDWLGFDEVAREFAATLRARTAPEGMVIGLEGKWGSGKSSLVDRIITDLSQANANSIPITLNFKPWLIGNRDALLTEFFNELSQAIARTFAQRGDATSVTVKNAGDLAAKLRTYAGYAGSLAPLASLGALVGVPGASPLEKVLNGLRRVKQESKNDSKPLNELKDDIEKSILRLNSQIVVFIDDVDRLEPSEISEILRLVRSVADFPLTTYVLCYDRGIVGNAIERAMKIKDGQAYIEKIFQLCIQVPAPEPFALRKMFQHGLSSFLSSTDPLDQSRIAQIIDVESDSLSSPRAVNRALDALRFQYASLSRKVDVPDLIWLTLIRLGNIKLYEWIESYVGAMSACTVGRVSIRSEWKPKGFEKLKRLLGKEDRDLTRKLIELSDYLPGIDVSFIGRENEVPIYRGVSEREISTAVKGKRLASPDHYRLFFALAVPSGAPLDEDYIAFFDAATEGPEVLAILLNGWLERTPEVVAAKAEIMLGRLSGGGFPELTKGNRPASVILALSNTMDHPSIIAQIDDFLGPPIWYDASEHLKLLSRELGDERGSIIKSAFEDGAAIGWLVNVLRTETFAHGLNGDRRRSDHEWILTEELFMIAVEALRQRFANFSMREILSTPSPINTLYAYSQIGENDAVVKATNDFISDNDENLIELLDHFQSTVNSSSGNYQRIDPESIETLIGRDVVMKRLSTISSDESHPARVSAQRYLQYIGNSL